MFEGMYSHIQKKPMRRSHLLDDSLSLTSFLDGSIDEISEENFVTAFVNDLKLLLEIESSYELIEELFSVERRVEQVKDRFTQLKECDLEGFYRDLAPVLLQKFWERKKNPLQEETIERLFLESIHIAIEEEIHIWQEKSQ